MFLLGKDNTATKEPNTLKTESAPRILLLRLQNNAKPLAERVKGALFNFDQAKLRLGIVDSTSLLQNRPRGYIEQSEWQEGEKASHSLTTVQLLSQRDAVPAKQHPDYGFVGLKSGPQSRVMAITPTIKRGAMPIIIMAAIPNGRLVLLCPAPYPSIG